MFEFLLFKNHGKNSEVLVLLLRASIDENNKMSTKICVFKSR